MPSLPVRFSAIFALTALFGFATGSLAQAEEPVYTITLEGHRFSPAELKIPAGKKVKLVVQNNDPTAEEFESYDLKREKIVRGRSQITIYVGPLKPGTYKYFGEFNIKTAQGVIVAEGS